MKLNNLLFFISICLTSTPVPTAWASPVNSTPLESTSTESSKPVEVYDTRGLSLSPETVREYDRLMEELDPKNNPQDFGSSKYDALIAALEDGSYVEPADPSFPEELSSNGTSPNPQFRQADEYPIWNEQFGADCANSNASPYWTDGLHLIRRMTIAWRKKRCDQDNFYGSRCRELANDGKGTQISICGTYSDWWVQCRWIMELFENVLEICGRESRWGRTSGQKSFKYDGGRRWGALSLRVVLH